MSIILTVLSKVSCRQRPKLQMMLVASARNY